MHPIVSVQFRDTYDMYGMEYKPASDPELLYKVEK